jgi:tRNA U34 5-methylaminomethyl-2-thiouridine-forming methyltransferase MnmC
MGERFELVTLRNGFRAIRERSSGEIMHPSVGPWAEARQLYVEQTRLAERLQTAPLDQPLRLYDVGLGGAANASAALACWAGLPSGARRPLEIVSFEIDLEPLKLAVADPEGFPFLAPWSEAVHALLETGSWSAEGVRWTLLQGEFLENLSEAPAGPELIFFDPFSPETNTPLWTEHAFAALNAKCSGSERGSLLVTYSASTRTRVSMLLGGFHVGVGEAIGTKKETTAAATSQALLARPLGEEWALRWRRSSSRTPWGTETLSEDLSYRIEAALQR